MRRSLIRRQSSKLTLLLATEAVRLRNVQHSPSSGIQGHFRLQILELGLRKCFREGVGNIFIHGAVAEVEGTISDVCMDEMVSEIDMFGA
jgi:hypothetical protein